MSNTRPLPYPFAEDVQDCLIMDYYEMNRYDEKYMQPAEVRIKALEDAGGGGIASGSILDLKGTPREFPSVEQCAETDWMVLVKYDGIYFRNPLTCEEFKPKGYSLKKAEGGVSHFLHLMDTPGTYERHAGKLLRVSDCETRLEYVDMPTHECTVTESDYLELVRRLDALEAGGGVNPPPPSSCSCEITSIEAASLVERVSRLEQYYGLPSSLRMRRRSRSSGCEGATADFLADVRNRIVRLNEYWGVDEDYVPPTGDDSCGSVTLDVYNLILDDLDRLEDYWGPKE